MKKYWLVKQNRGLAVGLRARWPNEMDRSAELQARNLRAMRKGDAVVLPQRERQGSRRHRGSNARGVLIRRRRKEIERRRHKPVKALKKPVTLEEIKAEPKLREIVLLRNSRLSVQPLGKAEFELICRL
jgi:predicted RNA-binding protein with PUA-like domain